MYFIETEIDGAYIVQDNSFEDQRGLFIKHFQKSVFKSYGLDCDFKECYYTKSCKDVIRGMHFQLPPEDHAKLVTVVEGKVLDVILDLRKSSKTYLSFFSIELSNENKCSLYIPKGVAHGFCSLGEKVITQYMVTSEHDKSLDSGVRYDSFGFSWPINNPNISDRDLSFLTLEEFVKTKVM